MPDTAPVRFSLVLIATVTVVVAANMVNAEEISGSEAARQSPDNGNAQNATRTNDTKRRARKRDFDARGEVKCAQEQGQTLGKCKAAAARSDGGDATVVVTFPNGFSRSLYFVQGEFVRASATMSGVGTDTQWRIDKGVYYVRVDDQRYEIPDTFVTKK